MCVGEPSWTEKPSQANQQHASVCECGHRARARRWCCVYELLRRSHFLSWEVVCPTSVCWFASCLNVGAALRPKSRFAFYRSEHLNNIDSKGKDTMTIQHATLLKGFVSPIQLSLSFTCFSIIWPQLCTNIFFPTWEGVHVTQVILTVHEHACKHTRTKYKDTKYKDEDPTVYFHI